MIVIITQMSVCNKKPRYYIQIIIFNDPYIKDKDIIFNGELTQNAEQTQTNGNIVVWILMTAMSKK